LCRTFHVAEKKRDGPVRQLMHGHMVNHYATR
jgi:hypothetical protein